VIFNNYYVPRDLDLNSDIVKKPQNVIEGGPLPKEVNPASIEEPILPVSEIGASVTEGQKFGTFVQSMQQAIRMGAGKIELSTQMGNGQEPVGAENYGREARQELREIAKANQVKIHSIHAPSNIGNMSGYNHQERGFNEEHRKLEIEEVRKAVDFAADVTQGGSVVVHTGEYLRDMTAQKWNRQMNDGDYEFQTYEEEPERQVLYMVDDRTGKLISEVRKSQIIREPKFNTKWNPQQQREMWVDDNENFLDDTDPEDLFKRVPKWDTEHTRFTSKKLVWADFEERARLWNKWYPRFVKDPVTKKSEYVNGQPRIDPWTPEEAFFKSQMDTQILQSRGHSLYHARSYDKERGTFLELKKALSFFKSIEDKTPLEEQWKLFKDSKVHLSGWGGEGTQFVPSKNMLPSEIIKQSMRDLELQMKYTHESSSAADAQADTTYETLLHVKPIEKYAKEQTSKSYAEAGIYSMDKTKEKQLPDPVFVAPENIFPEMGYGSHPEELIELVQDARSKMVEYLTKPYIRDPKMGWESADDKEGKPVPKVVKNPYFRDMKEDDARKYAEDHIKATFDTQHLGMWWKNFQPKPGETITARKERFDKWYMEQVQKLSDSGVVGNVHLVDGMGGGHHHLPAGQGNMPVVEAMKYLKKKGFKGSVSSEGFGESQMGADRQMSKTWEAMGNRIHSGHWGGGAPGFEGFGAPTRWTDIHQSYFGQTQSPYFTFGNYSPSNDWSLWSQVPME